MIDKNILLKYSLQAFIVSGIITVVVFFVSLSHETIDELTKFNWKLFPLMLFLAFLSWFCNGLRTWTLSKALGYRVTLFQSLVITMSTEFGIAASPGGFGGSVIRLSFMKEAGIPYLQGASLMATDLSMDLIFFVMLSPIALFLFITNYREGINLQLKGDLLYLLLFVMIFLLIFLFIYRKIQTCRDGDSSRFCSFFQKTRDNFYKSYDIIKFFLREKKKYLLANMFFVALQWISRYSILPLILVSFSQKGHAISLFFVQVVVFSLAFLFILPGGSGGVEVLTSAILNIFIPLHLVGIVLLLWRFFTYYLNLIFCGLVFTYSLNNMNKIFPKNVGGVS